MDFSRKLIGNLKLALTAGALASLVACSGSAGTAGLNGKDGTNGTNGKDGTPGPAGMTGPAGPSGDPAISGIEPDFAYLGRDREITINGYLTKWSMSTMVQFGKTGGDATGITVKKVVAASPNALVVTVSVAPTAKLGVHDVVVMDGATSLTYSGAFHIESPMRLVNLQGSQAQGSVLIGRVATKDFSTLFDTTSMSAGLFAPPVFTNIAINTAPGITSLINNVTIDAVDFAMTLDIGATTASVTLDLESGPMGNTTNFTIPGALNIAARSPMMLTAGTAAHGTVGHALDSQVFSFAPASTAASIVDVVAGTTNTTATPALFMLPKSGKWADNQIPASKSVTQVTQSTDQFFAIYWDNSGQSGYQYTVTANSTQGTAIPNPGTNVNLGTAVSTTGMLPAIITGGVISTSMTEHWFSYMVTAADIGKKFHVQTVGPDWLTDTVVDVFGPDGMTSLGGPSADTGYTEDFTSSATTMAGNHFIRVFASTAWRPSHQNYIAIIRLQ